MTPEQLARIEALCEEHKRMGCPGVVLPVAQVETLVSAYGKAQQVGRVAYLALLDHDVEKARNQLLVLPGVRELAEGRGL